MPPLDSNLTLQDEKARLRSEVLARRDALEGRTERSARIHARVRENPWWQNARALSTFVGVKSEVETLPLIETALAEGRRVSVPVVEGGNLVLYRIDAVSELVPAPFGLLEPAREFRRKARRITPSTIRLFLVPGVAFDLTGGRLGYGKGYYDALLGRIKRPPPLIGLGFDAQIVPAVPMGPTDQRLHMVATESALHLCTPVPEQRH